MDPSVQVAAIGILTTAVTTVGIIAVAFINNRKERVGAADASADRVYEERLKAKDDTIVARDAAIATRDAMIEFKEEQLADCRQDAVAKDLLLHARDEEIARLKDELQKRGTTA